MHVLHVIDALAVGGAERMLVELANRTQHDGHRVSVCVTRSDLTLAAELEPGIELVVLDRARRTSIAPLRKFARWVARERVDVIHGHGRSTFSLLALMRATRFIHAPVVVHDHKGIEVDDSVPQWFPLAARFAAAYIGVYPQHRAWARRAGIAAHRIEVIPNAIDMTKVAQRPLRGTGLPDRDHRSRLVFIGGLRDEKSVDVLLEAMARLRRPAHLSIIGGNTDPVYAARCRARAAKPDLADRVAFLGQRSDATALAGLADLAVHPSWSESGPLVLLEYAALGLPFVATRVGGIADALAEMGAGWFVPPRDSVVLAGAIDEFLTYSPDARRRLGNTWGTVARARFDIAVVMPRWYAVYEQVRR